MKAGVKHRVPLSPRCLEILDRATALSAGGEYVFPAHRVLPPLSVGEMTLRLYAALNYSQNSAHDLRRALNGA